MELTITVRRERNRYVAEANELPGVFFAGETECEARGKMEELAHALRSPHIHVERINADGSVVLTLKRREDDRKDMPASLVGESDESKFACAAWS